MAIEDPPNTFGQLLKAQGDYVITVEGIPWFDYNGLMMPACLPHLYPPIKPETAKKVVKLSGRPIARWGSKLGEVENSEWWYILKRGLWSIEDINNKKKRWMIRQGRKNFTVRPIKLDEVLDKCPAVAKAAVARYKGESKVETYKILQKHVEAARRVPDVLEYIGCFHKDTLVSFSENYIQDNAVWLGVIRYDPAFLNKYSSYGLMDGTLDYYLNQKKMDYVLDGSRRIYHRTEFQDHLIRVFDFSKEPAILHIAYSPSLGAAVKFIYPFRNVIWGLSNRWINKTLDKISAVLRQENIRRECKGL